MNEQETEDEKLGIVCYKADEGTAKKDKTALENESPKALDVGKKDEEANKDEGPKLSDVIKEQATEDEAPLTSNLTLRKILGGDILSTNAIRRQIWLFLLIAFFMIWYISNRYSCQKKLIEIDKLNNELQDVKYKALSSSSKITEKSRESNVLNLLKQTKDTSLHMADQPPYIIKVPEE